MEALAEHEDNGGMVEDGDFPIIWLDCGLTIGRVQDITTSISKK